MGELRLVICNILGSELGGEFGLTGIGSQGHLGGMILDRIWWEGL